MLIGLFLLYLAAFVAVFMAVQWLSDFLASATTIDSVTFVAALGAGIAIVILARAGLGGIAVTAAIAIFWALLIFGMDYVTVTTTLDIAAAVLCAAAASVLSESILRRVARKP